MKLTSDLQLMPSLYAHGELYLCLPCHFSVFCSVLVAIPFSFLKNIMIIKLFLCHLISRIAQFQQWCAEQTCRNNGFLTFTHTSYSWESSGCVVTRLWAGWQRNTAVIPGRRKRFFGSPECPYCARVMNLFIYMSCPESIQPFWISREPVVWPWCNLATSQRRPYSASVNRHSPVGLVSRQWDAVDWACVLCDRHIHNDRASRSPSSRQCPCPFYSSCAGFFG